MIVIPTISEKRLTDISIYTSRLGYALSLTFINASLATSRTLSQHFSVIVSASHSFLLIFSRNLDKFSNILMAFDKKLYSVFFDFVIKKHLQILVLAHQIRETFRAAVSMRFAAALVQQDF